MTQASSETETEAILGSDALSEAEADAETDVDAEVDSSTALTTQADATA